MNFYKKITSLGVSLALLTSITALPVSDAFAASTNLIANPSVETSPSKTAKLPTSWAHGHWGSNTSTFSYVNGGAQDGSYSLKVQTTKFKSGDSKWYFKPVNVSAGTQYNFSDHYISNVATEDYVEFIDGSGNSTYQDLGAVPLSSAWALNTKTITVPTGITQLTVFHLLAVVGSLQTDNYSLTSAAPVITAPTVSISSPIANANVSGTVNLNANAADSTGIKSVQFNVDGKALGSPVTSSPYQTSLNTTTLTNGSHSISATATNTGGITATSTLVNVIVNNVVIAPTNLLANPNLSNVSPTNPAQPANWTFDNWGTNTSTTSYPKTGHGNSRSISINTTAYTDGDAKWAFDPITAVQDQQYKYSEYYQSNVDTQVMAVFTMSDGSTLYQIIGLPVAASSWTNFSTEFEIPQGATNFTVYHILAGVGTLTTSDFSLTKYTPVGFSRPLVTLTFDDGYDNEFTNTMPLLQKYGFTSTQFIITNVLNTPGYMTNAQVLGLYQNGNEIASHTVTHNDLTQENPSQLPAEMGQSQATLQSITGHPVTDLAYPYGLYNSNILAATKSVYGAARGVENGLNSKDNFNPYDIKVQNTFNTTTTAQIADWVAQAKATNTWLVLVYHQVSPTDNSIYNSTPTQLDSELAAIKASGITVENMNTALSEVIPQL